MARVRANPSPNPNPNPSPNPNLAVHLAEARHRARLLRALLGVAKVTGRALILPRLLCYCDFMWKEMRACRVGGAETMRLPFDCPMVTLTPTLTPNP
jgi:hypothetical protein